MCVPGTECPILAMKVVTGANSNATFTSVGTLTSGATTDVLHITRQGNNSPLSEILASVDKVCKFNNDVGYWGAAQESKYLKTGSAGTTGSISYACDGGEDATFDQHVRCNF